MNIGAHVRGGGKLIPSLYVGAEIGATSIQVFTQSPRVWKGSQYAPETLSAYRDAQAAHPTISHTFCHASYLINLATADRELYEKSVACLTHNLSVARGMGSSGLVLHVGSHKGAGFDDVVRQIADAFERSLADATPAPDGVADCPILIENAAGSGGAVGRSFEEIQFLIDACNGDDRLGLCVDTQHLWASGFDYSSLDGTARLLSKIDGTVGMNRLRCLHLNDSKIELGGQRDRHANIGEGTIGAQGLAPLVGHPQIRELPLLLEVPGSGDGPRAEDVAAARVVVATGIELYDGPSSTALADTVPRPSVTVPGKSAQKSTTPAKKTAKKLTASAKKTAAEVTASAKKTAKQGSAVVKTAKKTAAEVTSSAKKTAKQSSSAVKKTAKQSSSAVKKTANVTAKKLTASAKKTAKQGSSAVKKTANATAKKKQGKP